MLGTRHEEYSYETLPFHIYPNLLRTKNNNSKDMNWHENLEIQICNSGSGTVLLNGNICNFNEDTIIVINSNVIHYTLTDTFLDYTAIIINSDFCRQMEIDYDALSFSHSINDKDLHFLLTKLQNIHNDKNCSYSTAKQTAILLDSLVLLSEKYSSPKNEIKGNGKAFDYVKNSIDFIRKNYTSKILLDDISRQIHIDKYLLSREFKKKTGQTVVEYINNYRCQQAATLILSGYSVSEASDMCGFENYSYFTKTFKKHMGTLPSKIKQEK